MVNEILGTSEISLLKLFSEKKIPRDYVRPMLVMLDED